MSAKRVWMVFYWMSTCIAMNANPRALYHLLAVPVATSSYCGKMLARLMYLPLSFYDIVSSLTSGSGSWRMPRIVHLRIRLFDNCIATKVRMGMSEAFQTRGYSRERNDLETVGGELRCPRVRTWAGVGRYWRKGPAEKPLTEIIRNGCGLFATILPIIASMLIFIGVRFCCTKYCKVEVLNNVHQADPPWYVGCPQRRLGGSCWAELPKHVTSLSFRKCCQSKPFTDTWSCEGVMVAQRLLLSHSTYSTVCLTKPPPSIKPRGVALRQWLEATVLLEAGWVRPWHWLSWAQLGDDPCVQGQNGYIPCLETYTSGHFLTMRDSKVVNSKTVANVTILWKSGFLPDTVGLKSGQHGARPGFQEVLKSSWLQLDGHEALCGMKENCIGSRGLHVLHILSPVSLQSCSEPISLTDPWLRKVVDFIIYAIHRPRWTWLRVAMAPTPQLSSSRIWIVWKRDQ